MLHTVLTFYPSLIHFKATHSLLTHLMHSFHTISTSFSFSHCYSLSILSCSIFLSPFFFLHTCKPYPSHLSSPFLVYCHPFTPLPHTLYLHFSPSLSCTLIQSGPSVIVNPSFVPFSPHPSSRATLISPFNRP